MRQTRSRQSHKSSKAELLKEAARLFGSIGGKARKKALTREQRREIARKGGLARQAKRKRK